VKHTLLVSVAVMALLAEACGDDGGATSADGGDDARTIEITMRDIAYEPTSLEVEAGETIRFVFTNEGDVDHDAFIGDAADQADHEAEMREAVEDSHGGGHDDGDDEDAITVEPGDTGEITHTFDGSGQIEVGCHEPGHYEAGMKIAVTVA